MIPDKVEELLQGQAWDLGGYVWRGQKDAEWGLSTSLGRVLKNEQIPKELWSDQERYALNAFRPYAVGALSFPPPTEDLLSWLILMQHYGAPTRLLDWTESPAVALYFAYREVDARSGAPAALWGYPAAAAVSSAHRPNGSPVPRRDDFAGSPGPAATIGTGEWWSALNETLRETIRNGYTDAPIGTVLPVPMPITPLSADPRMAAQQTVLTVMPTLDEVDLSTKWADSTSLGDPSWLRKFELPSHERDNVLSMLRRMNVTEASLFPGLDGLGRDVMTKIKTQDFGMRLWS